MEERMLNVKEVSEMLSVGCSTIWAWVAVGKFPSPIKLGPRSTRWRMSDLHNFLNGLSEYAQYQPLHTKRS